MGNMYTVSLANSLIVPAVWPVDFNTGANPGDYISMKNYPRCIVGIMQNTAAGTAAVTMKQAKTVSGTGEKTLSFTKYWMTGCKLKYKSASGAFTVGETVTGGGGGSGVVFIDNKDHLYLYTVNATAFVDGETITGGTSGTTATADGIGVSEDVLLPVTCASTFTIPAVAHRQYFIEITADMLDKDNDFNCIRLHIAQATNAGIGAAFYILNNPHYSGQPMPTSIYN
jgi:hypothetical protein